MEKRNKSEKLQNIILKLDSDDEIAALTANFDIMLQMTTIY